MIVSLRVLRFVMPFVFAVVVVAQETKPKPAPDVLVFNNGDQLTGKFERAVGGSVLFKSDMAGELTVGFDKIRELRTSTDVVALKKGPLKQGIAAKGTVAVTAGNVVITPVTPGAVPVTLAPKELAFLIDEGTYDREVAHQVGFLQGWNGVLTGGATIVRSTQTVPATPDVVVKTSIFHADAERDEYFKPTLYALVDTSQDHNFSQGLALQQVYGGGVGWTPIKSGKQELDVKADVHFEKQHFFSPQLTAGATPAAAQPDVNLFGSTFAETYSRSLPRKMVFTEVGSYLPGWTDLHAYSANVTGTLAMPVFKRLSVTVSTTDNYLNDPALGYRKNSYQFVTGVSYALK